jgi:predicted nucleotidyltransferase
VPKLCRINIDRSKEILDEIKILAGKLKSRLPITEIYLYGSFASGEIHEGSDIDLIIVGDFKEKFIERIGKIYDLTELPIEPLVYTHEEFEALKISLNPFILEVLKTAIRLA